MRIHLTSVFVDDQATAKRFYTEILGFELKHDVPAGEFRWLTVVSPQEPDGPELLLEPANHPAVGPYRDALAADGIPSAAFLVDDIEAEHQRLTELGVAFTQTPQDYGPVTTAVLIDTCGNLIQLAQRNG